jgi:hypothetical protein
MQADDLERLLRHWGRIYGWPPPDEWDEDDSEGLQGQTHALVAAMRVDGRVQLKLDTQLAKLRDKLKRRASQALRKTDDFRDPRELHEEHRCYGSESRGGAKPMKVHPEADHVDRVVVQLYTFNPVQGVIIRIEYCTRGLRHRDKAAMAGRILDNPHLTLRQYRLYLEHARIWMLGAMSVAGKRLQA